MNNMDYMRISSTELSSMILRHGPFDIRGGGGAGI